MASTAVQASQVCTFRQDGTSPRWLGQLGHVNALKYSFVLPGGPDQMSCTLGQPPSFRPDALNPGRYVKIFRGGSWVWQGILDEPSSDASGWSITAHGAGTYGNNYLAGWNTWNLNDPVNLAIAQGLDWVNPGITSGWLGIQPDMWSEYVSDWLTAICLQAGLVWYVGRGNVLATGLPPVTVNRLITCTEAVSRTVIGDVNVIRATYVASDDGNGNAVNAYVVVSNAADIAAHGTLEEPVDLTPAGVMTPAAATGYAQAMLNYYIGAAYAGPFTVRYGQLLTTGGSPIDLGTDQAATVARLIVTDAGYGGEVTPGPVTFVVGAYEYDDDAQVATITPWQSYRNDFSSLLTVAIPPLRQ